MSDIDPEGFTQGPADCICGPLYTYGGHEEPGRCAMTGHPYVDLAVYAATAAAILAVAVALTWGEQR